MNQKNKLQAVVSDLDGTILPFNSKVSNKDIESLETLGEKGILRIIATGRSIFSFNKAIPESFPIDYLIFSSGGGIMDFRTKKIIIENHHKPDDVNEIIRILRSQNCSFMVQRKIPDNHKLYYHHGKEIPQDYYRRLSIYKEHSKALPAFELEEEISQLIAIFDKGEDFIHSYYVKRFPELSVIRASSPIDKQSIWIEFFPKNVSKSDALKQLFIIENIKIDNSVVLGNDYNDQDMLQLCNNSFVVNESPDVLLRDYKSIGSSYNNPLTNCLKHFYSKSK